jgi:hypothetical protein
MPDNTPDEPAAGGAGRGAGRRRSGLDRLRATRGESPEPVAPDEPATGGDSSGGASAPSGAAATALLDPAPGKGSTPAEDTSSAAATTSSTDTTAGAADADDEAQAGSRRRRRRSRRAASMAPSEATPEETPAPAAGRRPALLVLVLALVVIGLAVPVIQMRHRFYPSKDEKTLTSLNNKRTAGLAAGRQFAITFFTFDYRKIDAYNKQILALSTGGFNQDFASKQGELKSVLNQVQSVATAHLLSAGVSNVSGNTVKVLVVADQDVMNKASNGKPSTVRYRLSVTMQQTPRGWLASDLEPVV